MQNEEPGLAGNLSLGYRSRKLDDVPSPSRTLLGTQRSVSLSSGWVINYHQLLRKLCPVPYFLFIHHLRGILGTLLRERQYLISE